MGAGPFGRTPELPDSWPTPEYLRQTYLATEISIDFGGQVLPAWMAVDHLGGRSFVVTAWNPGSEPLSRVENAERNNALLDELRNSDAELRDALGCAPDGSWCEESYLVNGPSSRSLRKVARQFGQEAIFELTQDELVVHGCYSTWRRSRPIDDPYRPSNISLAVATEAVFGRPASASFRRARGKGWRYEGDTGLECPCGGVLHLFGRTVTSSDGPYDAMAVVCASEMAAQVVSGTDARRSALVTWESYALARDDADQEGRIERERWVYVGELSDDAGPKDTSLPWVYVGETGLTPEERWQQHLDGHKASRWVRHFGLALRPDLFEDQPILRTRSEAVTYEAYLAERLRLEGYAVKGGH
jgi:hypothetical protein